MSKTVVTYPIIGCLEGAKDILGQLVSYLPPKDGEKATAFLTEFFDRGRVDITNIPEMKTKASWSADDINQFLAENGFDLSIDELRPDQFAVASLIKILVAWLIEGKAAIIQHDGQEYPAVDLTKRECQVGVYGARYDEKVRLVASIPTKSGDRVYMTKLPQAPDDEFELVRMAQSLSCSIEEGRARPMSGQYKGVIFPMVDLDVTHPLEWLVGLVMKPKVGDSAVIEQALQQTRLKMNRKGALAESAAAIVVRCLSANLSQPLVMDEPFLMWIERDGLSQPLFVAHVTPEDWKDPGEIEDL